MGKVLIIGAGGVGTVVVHKVAQNPDVFTEIMLASRTKSKCDVIAADVKARYGVEVKTAQVDADVVPELVALFNDYKPELVVNVALPYQDLTIMDACLEAGVNYMDTANYEPKDEAHFEYSWQWAYKEKFEKAGLTAILGCVLFALIPIINKERVTNTSQEKTTFKDMALALKNNKPFLLVIISYFLGFGRQMAMGIQVQAATVILGSQNLVAVLGIVTAVGSMISMALCPLLIKKLNERVCN
jgi:short subunit dehydrogenase-like uncharacterized protein